MKKEPNPYLLVVLTALLSGMFAISGFYLTANLQAENAIKQKQFEYRASAYTSFLESVSKSKSPIIAEILSIGGMSKHVATDGEVQALEDKFGQLSSLNNDYKISWQLDSDFSILRLHGSQAVRKNCDDILSVLALREHDVNWSVYPVDLVEFRNRWVNIQNNGNSYSLDEKVTGEERVMYILLSALYKNLLQQLREELHSENT